jgi:small GTP-binding protein
VLLKINLIGSYAVGKSSLANRFVNSTFPIEYRSIVNGDFYTKELMVEDKECKLQIWDTAGQERYRAIPSSYFRGASCVICCFDISRERYDNKIFEANIDKCLELVKDSFSDVPIILVGCKSDLEQERVVDYNRGLNTAQTIGTVAYFECSAQDNKGVDELFDFVARLSLRHNGIDVALPASFPDATILSDEQQHCSPRMG